MKLRKLIIYLKPYRKWAILAPFLILLEVIMDLSLPNIMADIVNNGIGNGDVKYILLNIGLMVLLTVIGVLGGLGSTYYAALASQNASADMRKDLFTKISKLSFFSLESLKPAHLVTVLTNDISVIGNIMMMGLRLLFRVPIIFVGSIFMAIAISPKLSLILVVLLPLVLIIGLLALKYGYPYFKKTQDATDDVNAVVRENIGGVRVVKSFTMEDYEIKRFERVNKNLMDIVVKALRLVAVAMPLMMLFINICIIFILWNGGIEVVNGNLKLGDIMAFIQYMTNVLTSFVMVSMVVVTLIRSEASAVRILDVFNQEDDFEDIKNPLSLEKLEGKVEFRNVSFSYAGGSGDAVLRNISFIANPGETIGIIGSTGSGKSTLVNLIPRFFDVSDGEILIDDINVKNYEIKYLRKNIGVVFQQAHLFADTIKNNLKYGNVNASDSEVEEVVEIAQAKDFINEKKGKYDYKLEQRATNLSGGQKQRMAIARALLMHPKILILDDATSAVDVKTDQKIKKSLKQSTDRITTFIVASRISSIMYADKIIVLEDGAMVGCGTHKELLKNNPYYREIYDSQLMNVGDDYA